MFTYETLQWTTMFTFHVVQNLVFFFLFPTPKMPVKLERNKSDN